jgi:putative ABC transport system permease protein
LGFIERSGGNSLNLWKLVIKEAWQRKWRLLVSVLALVLATGLIVTILSLNSSSRQAMHGYLKNLGANMMVIPAGLDLLAYYSADPDMLKVENVPESHFFRLLESEMEGIEGIDPRLTIPVEMDGVRAVLTGILPDKMLRPEVKEVGDQDPWEVLSLLLPDSEGAVLGAELKNTMNARIGSTIEASGKEIKVLGILPQQGTIDDIRIYVHLRYLQKWLQRPFALSEIRLLYTGNITLEKVASNLEGLLENTRVVTHSRMAKKQIRIMDSVNKYALALLGIILVLGCISIGNEIFHNAHERRREIGILTALGATTKTILAIFIMKAVFLALVGGILGYGIGALIALLLAPVFLGIHAYPSLSLIPLAVLVAVVFSVLSSMAPSWRASRMDPAEILQET